MKIWGYWATAGWAVVAFFAGQFVALAAVAWWLRPDSMNVLLGTPYDGKFVTLFILISNPVTAAVLVLAALLLRAQPSDYLALSLPRARDLTVGVVWLVGLIAVSDALLYASGHALVTPFQLQSYDTAAAEGWLPAMLIAAILVAPAGEEIIFRGFLFRGFARTEKDARTAIVVISVMWAVLHIQYDWTGMLQIFVVGLFLGVVRWRSGSTFLTFILHALFNLEGTLETALQIKYFS
jgi:uncharacterized protein